MTDIEICVDSVESAIAAERGGAQRVELCSALSEAGITPSSGLIQSVRNAISIDLFVIVRPRGGNFVYTDHEFEVMQHDIRHAQLQGVNGVVLGVLTPDNQIDRERTRELVNLARPLFVTFHRAFDECVDPDSALQDVIDCGADRILTSGGAPTALGGMDCLARLHHTAAGRIRIMAGGGVRASNVAQILRRTGISDVHTALKPNQEAAINSPSVRFTLDSTPNFVVAEEDVRAFKAAVDSV